MFHEEDFSVLRMMEMYLNASKCKGEFIYSDLKSFGSLGTTLSKLGTSLNKTKTKLQTATVGERKNRTKRHFDFYDFENIKAGQ